jgi:hypothetical protein
MYLNRSHQECEPQLSHESYHMTDSVSALNLKVHLCQSMQLACHVNIMSGHAMRQYVLECRWYDLWSSLIVNVHYHDYPDEIQDVRLEPKDWFPLH